VRSRLFLTAIGVALSVAASSAQTDIDAFMSRVLERRDDNWKKLQQYILEERETPALRLFLEGRDAASSVVSAVEVRRAARRQPAAQDADVILANVRLIELTDDVVGAAARLDPPELRTLDAIHLASALSLGPRIEALVAYDRRLVEAARAAGLDVRSPS